RGDARRQSPAIRNGATPHCAPSAHDVHAHAGHGQASQFSSSRVSRTGRGARLLPPIVGASHRSHFALELWLARERVAGMAFAGCINRGESEEHQFEAQVSNSFRPNVSDGLYRAVRLAIAVAVDGGGTADRG